MPERSRRSGVGTALFRALTRETVSRDCHRMDWAVLRWNQLALSFYAYLGAEVQDGFATIRLKKEGGPARPRCNLNELELEGLGHRRPSGSSLHRGGLARDTPGH